MARRRSETMSAIDVIMPLVDRFNELEQEDQRIFLDMVDPLPDEVEQPVPKKPKKRGRKAGSKSPRAASIAGQVSGTVRQLNGGVSRLRCAAIVDDNGGEMPCGEYADANVHHLQTYPNYHEFVPPAAVTKDDHYAEQAAGVGGGD